MNRTVLYDLYRDLPLREKQTLIQRFIAFSGRTSRTFTNYLKSHPPKAITPFFESELQKPSTELWQTL